MSVTLDSNLQTALDGDSHKPICKIISKSPKTTDYPLIGNYFNVDADQEESLPSMFVHSSGRLINVYRVHDVAGSQPDWNYDLYVAISDTDRTYWTHVELLNPGGDIPYGSFVPRYGHYAMELSGGNIGIVMVQHHGAANQNQLGYMIISPAGSIVTSYTVIATQNDSTATWTRPAMCETDTGLLCVYEKRVGSAYELWKRTCDSDFTNWSSETQITLSGISTTYDTGNPELVRDSNGDIYMYFDYVDDYVSAEQMISNIYVAISTDNGATWSTPEACTSYDEYGSRGTHPTAQLKSTGDIVLAYEQINSVLRIDETSTGACDMTSNSDMLDLNFDPTSRNLFAIYGHSGAGTKRLDAVLAIDVDTWTIEKCYSENTTPAFPAFLCDSSEHIWYNLVNHAVGGSMNGTGIRTSYSVHYLDHAGETITNYYFFNVHGKTKNVDWTDWTGKALTIGAICMDGVNNRVWVMLHDNYVTSNWLEIGYIDLDEVADPITGLYTWNQVYTKFYAVYQPYFGGSGGRPWLHVDPGNNRILFSNINSTSDWYGGTILLNYTTGSEIKHYNNVLLSGYPYRGLTHPTFHDGKIYGGFPYYSGGAHANRRGLCIIDTALDTVTYKQPTYATIDDYWLMHLEAIDTESGAPRLLIADPSHGDVIYNINDGTWEIFNDTNVPGYYGPLTSPYNWLNRYDDVENQIFTARYGTSVPERTLLQAYKEDGSFKSSYKYDGAYQGTASNFAYSNLTKLTSYSEASEADLALDEDDVLWHSWSYLDNTLGASLMWDRGGFEPELQDYLLAGSPVQIEWEVEKRAKASFSLARGDLFDVTNLTSILAPTLAKGRMVEIYFGETVGGNDYFQMQGEFFIVGTSTSFSKGQHPVIRVNCEDPSTFWDEMVITATPGYRPGTLISLLSHLLTSVLNLTASDYVEPTTGTIPQLHTLYAQWVDESMEDIMADIDTHFGVFRHWGVDSKLRWKKINLTASPSHTYSDMTHIINYSNDDRYSSFINAVVVTCEGIDPIEVLWDEEAIENLNGTLGFWTKEDEIRVYYSDDRTRRVRYPRLEVQESLKDFSPLMQLLGSDADEYISYEDPNETFCDIKQEAPDRAMYVFAFGLSTLALGYMAIGCDFDWTCSVWILLTNISLSALIQVLAAVANWRYTLWGRPVGHEMETYQARWDDHEFQTFMGDVEIVHQFQDPLSYTVGHCAMVANQEGTILQAQRRRVTFEKTAHLQDEIGDIIRINHPVSAQTMNLFVAKIMRVYVRPKLNQKGKFTDKIDGWRTSG